MSKLKSFLKFFPAFVLTAALGMWFGGFFDGYVFQFGFSKSFSEREARQLIGKQVRNVCFTQYERNGEVFGFSKDSFGDIMPQIRWTDTDPKSFTTYPKSCFEQCVKLLDAE